MERSDGVKEAVGKAQGAGIRVIMVTGDYMTTAAAIAREIGIGAGPPRVRVIEGSQLNAAVSHGLSDFDVVARAVSTIWKFTICGEGVTVC